MLTLGVPSAARSAATVRSSVTRPAVGAAGSSAGRYARAVARSKPSTVTRAATRPAATSTDDASSASFVSFSRVRTARRPGGASLRVPIPSASTSSSSIRHTLAGCGTWSRATKPPPITRSRCTVTVVVVVDGFLFGSAGGIRASRSEKS